MYLDDLESRQFAKTFVCPIDALVPATVIISFLV